MEKIKKIIIWVVILFTCLMFTSGCIALNSKSAKKDENGYYIYHYYSCGPEALEKIILSLEGESPTAKQISKQIQSTGNRMRTCAAFVIHHRSTQATWPSEIKNFLSERGYKVKKIYSMSDLNKNQKAIVLVRGDLLNKQYYHWLAYPIDESIEKFYGDKTKIVLILAIS